VARPKKQTVDYFPHVCKHGKTLFILEQKYGNDGYAFWFKLLEMLGSTNGHCIDLSDGNEWEYLLATTRMVSETTQEILDLLAKLEAIDPKLWEEKKVWSDNFITNISDAYRNRKVDIPDKPSILRKKPISNGQTDVINPQTKLKETKLKETKLKETKVDKKKKYAEFVTLTEEEHKKLVAEHGEELTTQMITILDNYKGANGKKYKSDYRAILTWVIKRAKEDKHGQNKPTTVSTAQDYSAYD